MGTEIASHGDHTGQSERARDEEAMDSALPICYLWDNRFAGPLTFHLRTITKTYSRPTAPNSSSCRQVVSPLGTCPRKRFHSQPGTIGAGQPAIATPCPACVRQIAPGYCLRAGSEIPGPSRLRREYFPATEKSSRTMRPRCAEMLFQRADGRQ